MRLLVVFLLFWVELSFADTDLVNPPDWVLVNTPPDKSEASSEEYSGRSTAYLLVDRQRHYTSNGESAAYNRYVLVPKTQDGVRENGTINLSYLPSYQTLELHHVRVIRNGEVFDRYSDARVSELDVEPESGKHLYSEEKQLSIIIRDLRIGDVVDYAFTIKGSNPVFDNVISSRFPMGWQVPVARVYSRLVIPSSLSIQYRPHGDISEPQIETHNDSVSYVWDISNQKAFPYEENVPPGIDVYPYVEFSQYTDWRDVQAWAEKLFELPTGLYRNSPFGTTWKSWREEVSSVEDDEQKILNALFKVQNDIRYVGIEIGENSHRPHSPDETLSLGYGDCKDKTLLLVSLLKGMGFVAEPALVSTRYNEGVSQRIPSGKLFDHVVARVRWHGKWWYLDPTKTYQGGSRLNQVGYRSYGVALPVYSDDGLENMPRIQGVQPSVRMEEVYTTYHFEGPVKYEVTTHYTGSSADYQRYRFANTPMAEIEKQYLNFYLSIFSDIKAIDSISVDDNQKANIITIKEEYWVFDFWEYDLENERYNYQIYGSLLSDLLVVAESVNRKYPYDQPDVTRFEQTIKLAHPYGIGNTYEAEPLIESIESEYFDFTLQSQDYTGASFFQYEYIPLKNTIDTSDFDGYKNDVDSAKALLSYSGWVGFSGGRLHDPNERAFFAEFLSLPSGDAVEVGSP